MLLQPVGDDLILKVERVSVKLGRPNWELVAQERGMKAECSASHSTSKHSRKHKKSSSVKAKCFYGGIQYYDLFKLLNLKHVFTLSDMFLHSA